MKPKLGRIMKVTNAKPKFGSLKNYNYIKVTDVWGHHLNLLMTDRELKAAMARGDANPEDCPKRISFRDWLKR